MKIADMVLRGLAWLALGLLRLAWWGLSYPLGDLVALVLVAVLFWRFNLGARAMERNRARAMRWRARCRLRPGPGFASLAELGTQWSRTAAAHRGGRVRPGLTWRQRMVATAATAYALRLGRAQFGKRVFGSMEANWLMIAPPRKHKSGMLADLLLDWPGAAIATSTRADLFSLTAGARWRHGPVFVFNPYEVGGVPSSFGWDVVSGCENPAEAFIRADSIIGPRTETGDMAWWQDKAAIALAALLHAAALSGRTVLDIWDWANREGDAIGGSVLAGHPAASRQLRSVFAEATREGRSPDSIRMTMAKSLTWVADPAVAAMVHGPAARPFDADAFAASCGTLYMIAPGAAGATIAPLFRCFTDYVQRMASLSGSRRPAGKLDPPLLPRPGRGPPDRPRPAGPVAGRLGRQGHHHRGRGPRPRPAPRGLGSRRRGHHLGHHQQDHHAGRDRLGLPGRGVRRLRHRGRHRGGAPGPGPGRPARVRAAPPPAPGPHPGGGPGPRGGQGPPGLGQAGGPPPAPGRPAGSWTRPWTRAWDTEIPAPGWATTAPDLTGLLAGSPAGLPGRQDGEDTTA